MGTGQHNNDQYIYIYIHICCSLLGHHFLTMFLPKKQVFLSTTSFRSPALLLEEQLSRWNMWSSAAHPRARVAFLVWGRASARSPPSATGDPCSPGACAVRSVFLWLGTTMFINLSCNCSYSGTVNYTTPELLWPGGCVPHLTDARSLVRTFSSQVVKSSQVKQTLLSHVEKWHCGLLKV